ncbi:GAF domain-containing protein [Roseomonas populi]|uniref:GAF domain-containing protein n=1 Tax=Roseomonas populi TaxID=3121582 RepID=A0ABT1XCI6_9PROT|nr:GAF domain-containing protein [Roseomonas pecuniae]MCR0985419.1 GAF domain-containing protein [Roseomonas pecuniae]
MADYAVMDTPAEPAFDQLVHEAAQACRTPIAVMSLIGRRRQWFKARVGVELTETPIEHAVCVLTITDDRPLVISDLTEDPRTAANPLVTGEPHVRFYAGAPIRLADGLQIGSLCVVDTVPRPQGLTSWQELQMLSLASRAEALLDERKRRADPNQALRSSALPKSRGRAHGDEEELFDLRDFAGTHGLTAAETFLRLTIEALAKQGR